MNPEEEFLPEWLVVGGPTTTTIADDDDDDDHHHRQHLLRLLNSLLNNANGLAASTLKDVRRRCKDGKESIERYSPAHFAGAFDDGDHDDGGHSMSDVGGEAAPTPRDKQQEVGWARLA